MHIACFVLTTALALKVNAATVPVPAAAVEAGPEDLFLFGALQVAPPPMGAAPVVVVAVGAEEPPAGNDLNEEFLVNDALEFEPAAIAHVINAPVQEPVLVAEEDPVDRVDAAADGYITQESMETRVRASLSILDSLRTASQNVPGGTAEYFAIHARYLNQSRIDSIQRMIQATVARERATREHSRFIERTANLAPEIPDYGRYSLFPTNAARLHNRIARERYDGLLEAESYMISGINLLIDAKKLEILRIYERHSHVNFTADLTQARAQLSTLEVSLPYMDPARVDTTVYSIIRSVELDVSTAGADQVQQQVRGAAFTARVQAFPIGPLDALVLEMLARYPPTTEEAFSLPVLQALVR